MMRTKWMRLGVRDPADILRWAAAQSTRQLDDFRYRVIHGREYVSFRLQPRYAIQIGTSDIVVVAYVKPSKRRHLAIAALVSWREVLRRISTMVARLQPRPVTAAPIHTAALYEFAPLRASSPHR